MSEQNFVLLTLKKLADIPEVVSIDVLPLPEYEDADVAVRFYIRKPEDANTVIEKMSDIQWEVYEETGFFPAVYWEFAEVKNETKK